MSNMSSLTKKLLFFGVFSIVCNFTTSDINECRASVHEVFLERMQPWQYLKYAMFSLSEKLIKKMGSTQDYVTYYNENTDALQEIDHSSFAAKHKQTIIYFDLIIASQNSLSTAQNNIPEETNNIPEETNNIPKETKKKYILGYFKSLVSKLKKSEGLINSYVTSPDKLCNQRSTTDPLCREAFYKMFGFDGNDLKKKKLLLRKMNGYDAFMLCYGKYNHLDITMANIFPGASDTSSKDFEDNQSKLGIIAAYLTVMTDAAIEIVKDYTKNHQVKPTTPLFPTIDEYCNGASSSSNLQPKE